MAKVDSFDPELLVAMGAAFDGVLATMYAGKQPLFVRETVALCILGLAEHGERSRDRLFTMTRDLMGMVRVVVPVVRIGRGGTPMDVH